MADEIQQLTNLFMSGNTQDVVDVVTFVESPWGLGFKLLPNQRFLLKAYYGLPLNDKDKDIDVPDLVNDKILYKFTEKEFLKWLYDEGRCNTDITEGKYFHELVWVAGRRGTKSTCAAIISTYEMYKLIKRGDPSKYYGFPPDVPITILNVAPTDEQASIVYSLICSQALNCPYLKNRIVNNTLRYFNMQTDSDRDNSLRRKRASIASISGGCSSNSLRGHNTIVVIMDEFAFFINNDGRFSGDSVYRALTPSVADFQRDGRIVTISSPWRKDGKFYERYQQSFEEQDTTLMFKMYSAMCNPKIDSTFLKAERRRDRSNFLCEFGAEFSDSVVAWIDDPDEFKSCVKQRSCVSMAVPGNTYYAGVDVGLKNDASAVAVVHKEGNTIFIDHVDLWFSGSSDVWEKETTIYEGCRKYADNDILRMTDIANEIALLHRKFGIKEGFFDQYQGYSLAELLHNLGLKQFEVVSLSEREIEEMFDLFKTLYTEKLLDFPNHPVLLSEMLLLEGEKKSNGRIKVRAPNRSGAHDDLADAIVRAVWLCYNKGHKQGGNVTSLVGGGGNIITTGGDSHNVSYNGHMMHKQKLHGEHPRLGPLRASRNRALSGLSGRR